MSRWTEYTPQVTIENLFNDFSNIEKSYSDALRIYSEEIYYPIINSSLRSSTINKISDSLKRLSLQNHSDKNDRVIAFNALDKMKKLFNKPITIHVFPRKIELYRGINKKYLDSFTKDLYSIYQDGGFTSTSLSMNFVLEFKQQSSFKTKLHLLPGITYNVVALGNLSSLPDEKEVLINSGCVYFYIGSHNIINKKQWANLPMETNEFTIYEFILLPNMETYKKIGKEKLIEIGKEIVKETIDIVESINLLEIYLETVKLHLPYNYPLIHIPLRKYTYMEELTYLIQVFITKDILKSPNFYKDFEVNISHLQRDIFIHVFLDPIHKYFKNERYFIERQKSYIEWFIYLIDKGLLTSNNKDLVNNIDLLDKQTEMKNGLLKHLRELSEYIDTYNNNNGGSRRRISKKKLSQS